MTQILLYPKGFSAAKKEAETEVKHSFAFHERIAERINNYSLEKISKTCPDITGTYVYDKTCIEVQQHIPNKIIESYIIGQQTTYGFGRTTTYFRDEFTPEEAHAICAELGKFCKQKKEPPLLTQLEKLFIKTSKWKSTEYMTLDVLYQYITTINSLNELDAYVEAGELQFLLLKRRFDKTIYGELISSSEHALTHEQNRVRLIFKKNDNKPHTGLLHFHAAPSKKPLTRQETGALTHLITLLNNMNSTPDNPTYRTHYVALKYMPAIS